MFSLLPALGLILMMGALSPALADSPHEVWAIDQSNSPGKTFGGRIYIWQGNKIEAQPERTVRAEKMYIDSGGDTPSNLYEADLYALPLTGYAPANPPNSPAPRTIFSEDVENADTHGAAVVHHGRNLWVTDRGRNFLFVVDTSTDTVVNRINLVGEASNDPTPDLLVPSPQETRVYMSLRGPNPLTAAPHVSTGSPPASA